MLILHLQVDLVRPQFMEHILQFFIGEGFRVFPYWQNPFAGRLIGLMTGNR